MGFSMMLTPIVESVHYSIACFLHVNPQFKEFCRVAIVGLDANYIRI